MKKSFIILICLISLTLLTACDGGADDGTAFVIAGSTSVQPYVEMLVEYYEHYHPERFVDVQGGGSSSGIQAATAGTAALGMSSRNLRGDELYLWSHEIARDALAIIVHPSNEVGNLTLEQIRKIYTAEITNWSELGGDDARIHIITREEGSGTRAAFEELVMDNQRITPRAIVQDSNGSVRQLVSGDRFSIGYISLGLVDIGENSVNAVRIGGVAPTAENVRDYTYALFRRFLLVSLEEPTENVMDFIHFIDSEEGHRIMIDEGLIP